MSVPGVPMRLQACLPEQESFERHPTGQALKSKDPSNPIQVIRLLSFGDPQEHHGLLWFNVSTQKSALQGRGEQFPYMSQRQNRTALRKLLDARLIRTGVFNRAPL